MSDEIQGIKTSELNELNSWDEDKEKYIEIIEENEGNSFSSNKIKVGDVIQKNINHFLLESNRNDFAKSDQTINIKTEGGTLGVTFSGESKRLDEEGGIQFTLSLKNRLKEVSEISVGGNTHNNLRILRSGGNSIENVQLEKGFTTDTENNNIIIDKSIVFIKNETEKQEIDPEVQFNSDISIGTTNEKANVKINGDLIVTGTSTKEDINVESINVENNEIVLNSNLTENPLSVKSGVRVNRGNSEDYLFVFDESDDQLFKIGKEENLQVVSTREKTIPDNDLLIWDSTNSRIKKSEITVSKENDDIKLNDTILVSGTMVPQSRTVAGKSLASDISLYPLNLGSGLVFSDSSDSSAFYDSSSEKTIQLSGQIKKLHEMASNGFFVKNTSGSIVARTIEGTTDRISVTNGDGSSKNPTIDISSDYIGQDTITTLGTITSGTWDGNSISINKGGTGVSDSSFPSNGELLFGSDSEFPSWRKIELTDIPSVTNAKLENSSVTLNGTEVSLGKSYDLSKLHLGDGLEGVEGVEGTNSLSDYNGSSEIFISIDDTHIKGIKVSNAVNADKVNNLEVKTTVPKDAVFTDNDTITKIGTSSSNLSSGDITLDAGEATTVSKSGNTITISSTDTDTTYSEGTGLNLDDNNTFSVDTEDNIFGDTNDDLRTLSSLRDKIIDLESKLEDLEGDSGTEE